MSDRIYLATRKGLFIVERGSSGWSVASGHFLGDRSTIVFPDARDESVYIDIHHDHFGIKVHRSPDRGKTWEEVSPPVYPERPEDADDINPMTNKPVPWTLEMIWALASAGDDQPGHLWCGTIPGGLFHSPDRGNNWELNRPLWDHPDRKHWFGGGADLPGIHSICVHPKNSKHITVGVSCGGVWISEDGGESWNCFADGMRADYMPPEQMHDPKIQDVHCLVQCKSAPDHYWGQHHNGVFRTTDGAKSWQEVTNLTPSSFGFPVAVHPEDPNTAWFVPAIKDEKRIPVDGKVVVTRTRDGGESCEVLTDGLPQQYAYDLVFRHALDIDSEGQRLAFGSTTGSLWVSEDQGDSWQTVSEHLPPIYCVRFG